MFIEIPDCIQIRGDRLLVRKCYEEFNFQKKKSESQVKNENNLKFNTPSGHINRKIKLKINRILSNWISSVNYTNENISKSEKLNFTFVTLTLPAKQMHSDAELYKLALNRFIITIQRKYKVTNYLWRAERQKNSNLHYHLIIDKYIHYADIRRVWNLIMKDLKYIEEYKKNQNLFHSNGFKLKKESLKFWSAEKQLKAYYKGISEGWENPNSTDIHNLKSIKNISNYMMKYISKCDLIDDLEILKEDFENKKISLSDFNTEYEILLYEIEKEKINGRVWGCSDDIKLLKDPIILECLENSLLLNQLQNSTQTKIIEKDFCTIYYNKKLPEFTKRFKYIQEEINKNHLNNFLKAYNKNYLTPEQKRNSHGGNFSPDMSNLPTTEEVLEGWKPIQMAVTF